MIFFHLNFKFKIFRVQVRLNNFRLNTNKLWIEDYMKISNVE